MVFLNGFFYLNVMTIYRVKPSEEAYGFDFTGKFIPQKFNPLWFHRKGLLGEEEAAAVELEEFEKEERMKFSTKFLTIDVDTDNFRIYSSQYLSLSLAKDMAVSLVNLLGESLSDEFVLYSQLHISYPTNNQFRKALNKLGSTNHWAELLQGPQMHNFRIVDNLDRPNATLLRVMGVEPCGRDDMQNTIHLTVSNIFTLKDKQQSIEPLLTADDTTFPESIELLNKMIKLSQ